MVMPQVPPIEHQPIRRMKRAEYDLLVKQGVFGNERVELIFGQVVAMSPIDPAHREAVAAIHEKLLFALTGRARVYSHAPLAATDDSEPETDTYVTPLGDYWDDHPSRAYLVVEVARSSLEYDRGEKAFLYGISQVDEYWIVDQVHGLVECDVTARTVRGERSRRTGVARASHLWPFPMSRSRLPISCRPSSSAGVRRAARQRLMVRFTGNVTSVGAPVAGNRQLRS